MGMIGLGKMGGNMVRRLLGGGHRIVGFDRDAGVVADLIGAGMEGASDLGEMLALLGEPGKRAVWMMVPAGPITQSVLDELAAGMSAGDIIIDGGNSNYKDTMRRAEELRAKGIHYVDVGTSGGVWGLQEGYAMMVGGDAEAVERLRPLLETLAPAADRGWGRMGPSGSGHYVKMVHNGIEYGMMQAYAEGFELMRAKDDFGLDMAQIAELWRHGSVIRSWLLDLTAEALQADTALEGVSDYVADSGEGRWTIIDSIEEGVPTPVITLATQMRFRSQQQLSYAGQMLSVMRRAFGGHAIKTVETHREEGLIPDLNPANTSAAEQLGETGQQRVKDAE